MANVKIVQTFILTVSKSSRFNKDQRTVVTKQQKYSSLYFCFVITVHRKLYPVPRIIAVPPPPVIDNCLLRLQKKEKISATKNLLKRDLGFTFTFSFLDLFFFFGFVLFVCLFFISSHCEYA